MNDNSYFQKNKISDFFLYTLEAVLLTVISFAFIDYVIIKLSDVVPGILLSIFQPFMLIVIGVLFLKYHGKLEFLNYKRLTEQGYNYLIKGLLLTFSSYIVLSLFFMIIMPIDQIGEHSSADTIVQNIVFAIFLVVLLGPISEELFFRGVIQNRLESMFNIKFAIILTSLIFAFIHTPVITGGELITKIPFLTIVFSASIVFGYIYWKSENLLIPTILHLIFNLTSVMGLYINEIVQLQEKLLELIS